MTMHSYDKKPIASRIHSYHARVAQVQCELASLDRFTLPNQRNTNSLRISDTLRTPNESAPPTVG